MSKIDLLKNEVEALYGQQRPERTDWADWLYANHVFQVAELAHELAGRYGADSEQAEAAAMLHDVADAVMKRFDPAHEERSTEIARDLLQRTGFSEAEIGVIVDDALRCHGCHEGCLPQTEVGRVMATADAMAHLDSGFYDFAHAQMSAYKTKEEMQKWALPKIERDFYQKIAYPEVRQAMQKHYERCKALFA
jgi:HD superfamily phosphohydrolase YqeK